MQVLPLMLQRTSLLLLLFILSRHGYAQLAVQSTMTPAQLVEDVLLGGGITVSNISFNGVMGPGTAQAGTGSFTGGENTNLGLEAGVILSSGNPSGAANPQSFHASTNNGNPDGDPDLVAISNATIRDHTILEFDFVPTGDTLRFRYVFGSEEYPNFVCSMNDAFGFFLSGPGINGPYTNNAVNIALIPGTTTPVTISNVNHGQGMNMDHPTCPAQNPDHFINNTGGTSICYNGFTVVLTAFALVTCGETYHIKLAIADAGDTIYDSAVFLEAGSFTSTGQVIPELAGGVGVDGNTMTQGCGPFELVFTRLGDFSEEISVELEAVGTAVPNVNYSPPLPSTLVFPPGVTEISIWVDVPAIGGGPETMVINIVQLIICAGQEVQTTFTFNLVPPPPLELEVYDINGICGETHLLDPQVSGGLGEYEYNWSTGSTEPSIEVSPGVTTVYTLTVSDACEVPDQTVEYTVTLPVYLPIDITMGPDVAIDCLGSDVIEVLDVTGGDGNYTYQWSQDGTPAGTGPQITVPASAPTWYVVLVTDGCGFWAEDSLMVSTVPLDPIEITTTGDVTVICPGDETLMGITAVTGGNGVFTYQWTDQDGTEVSTATSHAVVVDADHTYTITATDQCDNVGTTTITTFLPVYEQFRLQLPADQIICAGDELDILALVTGGSGFYFLEWEGSEHNDPWLSVAPMEDTYYHVTATDQCGEVVTDDMLVQVEHVHVDIVETNRGLDDWYLQAATTPYAETWLWDMGDGARYRGATVEHSYLDLEEHWVTLSITTPNGCEGMDSLLLRAPAQIFFPNAFSPDGDGHNDLFGPITWQDDIIQFEMEVFDRWGHRVFYSQNIQDQWDGTMAGTKVPLGVYVYKYQIEGHYLPSMEGYGHVTVLQGSVEQ